MKRRNAFSILAAVCAFASGAAVAQGDGDQEMQRRAYEQAQRANRAAAQRDLQRDSRREYQRNDRYANERGAGPDHRFHRGDRLPMEYRHRNYVVDDWRSHRLSAPPRGHHWVQSGNDYLLVAIATGVIANVVLGN